ncbi:hypothetical protein L3X38_040859 [Prunus dulcis]|uniref:Uncharacterized protein n=1 Tax=Prunus dulcis TaxID=3755 RepID=A0AAD4UTN0_PRUDU|nr:hypothetical protein L3X38_040859 [Prunus dulcis]
MARCHGWRTRTRLYKRLGHRASPFQVSSNVRKIGQGTRREDVDAKELGGLEGSRRCLGGLEGSGRRLGGLEGCRRRLGGMEGCRRRLGGLEGSRRPGRI